MSKRLFAFACLLLTTTSIFPTIAFSALTQDPALNWHTLYSDHFEVHFHDGEEKLAREVANISEQVHNKLSKTLNWEPELRTQVVLTDRFDYSNGFAYSIPHNWMQIIVTPPDSFSTLGDYDNWLKLLITHEYTHVLHFDKVSGLPQFMRYIFGRFLPLFPNLIQPPWLIEGLATYQETDIERGSGRGQSSIFRMMMRMEVENGIKPLKQINQPIVSWPMNTSRYLYGVYFYNFIVSRYGEEKIQELVEHYSDNLLPFAINSNSNDVLGKTLGALWIDFSEYLKSDFSTEIQGIRKKGVTAGEQLTYSGYFTATPRVASNGDVYFIQKDMRSEARLMLLKKGEKEPRIVTNTRGRYFDIHPQAGIIIAELDTFNNTNIFSDLYHINPDSGDKTQITHGGRYIYASWSPDGKQIIAIQNKLGEHAIHLLDAKGKIVEVLWQGSDKIVLGPPDWSPNGNKIVISVWKPSTQWNLEIFDITRRQWNQLTHSSNIETTPQFTADGQEILFSADYQGVFNLQRLNLANGSITTLSNVIGGAFSPTPAENNQSLYYIGIGNNGYDLFHVETPLATPAVQENKPITTIKPEKKSGDQILTATKDNLIEDYNGISHLMPTGWLPLLYTDTEHTEALFLTWGSDPIRRHSYNLLIAHDITNQWLTGRLDYLYDRWEPTIKFSLDRQVVRYLNSNNNIERYRNLDTFTIEGLWSFLSHEQQWLFHAGIIHETESDKDIRSSFGPLPAINDDLAGIAVSFNSSHRYPISISPNDGRQVKVIAEDHDALDSYHTGQIYTVDWKEFFSLSGQHVLTARGVIGWGTDNPDRFRLGGTLETSVSAHPQNAAYAATQRIFGQRQYPLHGYPTGRSDLTGRRMVLAELEWRFPIALIERGLMSPPIGVHQLHGKFFYNAGETWDKGYGIPALRTGAGAELTTELVLGYWLPLDVRIGYARGFNVGGEEQTYMELRASF